MKHWVLYMQMVSTECYTWKALSAIHGKHHMEAQCAEQASEHNPTLGTLFWSLHLLVKPWVMAMVGDPPGMVGETGLGSARIAQALGNELAGFLVVPQIMEHCQVDKPVHPPLGEPWPGMGWSVALGMAFAMALVMAFAMALVMAFAMALVMVFAMALASSAVTWCNHLGQKMW